MFDSIKELGDELKSLIINKKIEIENFDNDKIILKLELMARNNNFINLILKRIDLNDKDKINYVFEEIKNLKNSDKIKDKIINDLVKKIFDLEKINSEFKKELDELKNKIEKNNIKETILSNINSKIFQNESEIEFILSNIKNNPKSLELLYSSEIEGENENKFKTCYTNKNDILILIKTKKDKRFGGYSHESFLREYFDKKDINAFLFNLDKKKIYKSKGRTYSIWCSKVSPDSMNFGNGADLKIYNKFFSKEGKAHQLDYEYDGEEYALNGEEFFKVSVLELYQIKF